MYPTFDHVQSLIGMSITYEGEEVITTTIEEINQEGLERCGILFVGFPVCYVEHCL